MYIVVCNQVPMDLVHRERHNGIKGIDARMVLY